MGRPVVSLRSLLWLALPLVSLTSCKQGSGDRCEIDDDCSGALVCRLGICESPNATVPRLDSSVDVTPREASAAGDVAHDQSTGAADAPLSPDGPRPDAGSPPRADGSSAAPDAPRSDASTAADGALPADAGADASAGG